MNVARFSDGELLVRTACARLAAHAAPLNTYHMDHNGHRWVESTSTAWADRANEWMQLAAEVDRRGLQQPALQS